MLKLIIIGAGGFFGAIARYLISGYAQTWSQSAEFPYGTLAANFIGCLIIGFLGRFGELYDLFSPQTRALVFVGFLGALTTFSTFGNETLALLRDGRNSLALLNMGANLILCLGAVWTGQVFAGLIGRMP